MKKGIHPDYKDMTVTLVDGSKVQMKSTLGKDLHLDIDPSSHPAWTGKRNLSSRGGQAERFNKRFAGFKVSS